MKVISFKYLFMICMAITFFIKVANVVSYMKYSNMELTLSSENSDATEKQADQKTETEYFTQETFTFNELHYSSDISKKIVAPGYFSKLDYFPEVLTPPPLA